METEKEMMLREGNVSLILDSYNDIFSDFDPRPSSERSLSQDFLEECNRASRDQHGITELRLMVPRHKKDTREEMKIKTRLIEHFQKHFHEKEEEIRRIKRTGIIWTIFGAIILAAIILLMINSGEQNWTSLLAILEIPCWFLMWEGMGKIFFDSKEIEPELQSVSYTHLTLPTNREV